MIGRVRGSRRLAPTTSPAVSRLLLMFLDDDGTTAASFAWTLGVGVGIFARGPMVVIKLTLRFSGKSVLGLQWWMRLCSSILGPWDFIRIALADEAPSSAIYAFGLSLVALLLPPSAGSTAGLGPICKLPLPLLWVHLDASARRFHAVEVAHLRRGARVYAVWRSFHVL